jgi:hypothetical protein
MLEQEAIMKGFLRLKVEALARVRDDALDELVTHAEVKVLEQGSEIDVRRPPTWRAVITTLWCETSKIEVHHEASVPQLICITQPLFVPWRPLLPLYLIDCTYSSAPTKHSHLLS